MSTEDSFKRMTRIKQALSGLMVDLTSSLDKALQTMHLVKENIYLRSSGLGHGTGYSIAHQLVFLAKLSIIGGADGIVDQIFVSAKRLDPMVVNIQPTPTSDSLYPIEVCFT